MVGVHRPEAINWKQVLSDAELLERLPEDAEMDVKRQGRIIHRWLQDRYETGAVPFERELMWKDVNWKRGRFDAFDGHYVYEFKSVAGLPEDPRRGDAEQLKDYLYGLRIDTGFLVYIDRDEGRVRQFRVER